MKGFKKLLFLTVLSVFAAGVTMLAYGAEKKTEYKFTYGDNQYQIGMEAKTAMDKLGKAGSSRDVNNCSNGYVNKAYMYGDKDFEVYVEQSGGKEIVASITLLTSKVSTEEGLKTGDGADKVIKAYPEAKKGLGSYSAVLGNTKLYIKMKGEQVSYISYMLEQ